MSYRVTDLFCGCGGSSTGAAAVPGVEVTHAINHWGLAVEAHRLNHPRTETVKCDLLDVHPAYFPRMDILCGSPVCTEDSWAGLGQRRRDVGNGPLFESFDACELSPREIRNRATLDTMARWTSVHRPKYVVVENVVELVRRGEKERAAGWNVRTFGDWLGDMLRLGYRWRPVCVNAAHVHGLMDERVTFWTPQSRDRLYLVFWRKDVPEPDLEVRLRSYCPQCEAEREAYQAWKPKARRVDNYPVGKYGRYGQYVYRCAECHHEALPFTYPALSVIDWAKPMTRIGDRAAKGMRPLTPKTIARIEKGLRTHGLRRQSFVVANRTHNVPRGADEPLAPINTGGHHLLATIPAWLDEMRGTGSLRHVSRELHAITAGGGHHHLVTTEAALAVLRGPRTFSDLDGPLPTQTAAGSQFMLLRSPYVVTYNGQVRAGTSALGPLGSITTVARHRVVSPPAVEEREDVRVEDLHTRMMQSDELLPGGGYPPGYQLVGTEQDRICMIGNGNPPAVEQMLVQRCVDALEGRPA